MLYVYAGSISQVVFIRAAKLVMYVVINTKLKVESKPKRKHQIFVLNAICQFANSALSHSIRTVLHSKIFARIWWNMDFGFLFITFAVNYIFLRFFGYSFILLVFITLLNFKKFCSQFFVVGQLKFEISFFSKFFIFKKYFWPCSPANWILYFIFIYAWNDSKFNGLSKNV